MSLRKLGIGCFGLLALVVVVGLVLFVRADQPLPTGEPGPAADQLARQMMAAVDTDAWKRTGAVAWDFGGRQQHLWDRQRSFARVSWQDHEVLLDLSSRQGLARRQGERVPAAETQALLEKAWSFWCNDSFWLNPVAKLFDDGTQRSLIESEGQRQLLVTYDSGGVTPGDSYLWTVGADQRPTRWQMWTQILPIGGVEATWEDWITLDTGAVVATRHKTPIFELVLSDVRGASSLADLDSGPDPFAELAALLQQN